MNKLINKKFLENDFMQGFHQFPNWYTQILPKNIPFIWDTRLDSCFTQNHNFYWKPRKIQIDQDMVAYYLRKWDFASKDFKWVFEIHFNGEYFEKKFLFKKKDMICKQQYTRLKQRQPRGRQNFKVKFLTTNQTNLVGVGANFYEFLMTSKN